MRAARQASRGHAIVTGGSRISSPSLCSRSLPFSKLSVFKASASKDAYEIECRPQISVLSAGIGLRSRIPGCIKEEVDDVGPGCMRRNSRSGERHLDDVNQYRV
ncbi:hypothetical protein B0H11DRAFT_2221988 [Mycena galericulata]|nr:hypothetical protein B0H11DRAFT_2221988 [Mycena galericulata]